MGYANVKLAVLYVVVTITLQRIFIFLLRRNLMVDLDHYISLKSSNLECLSTLRGMETERLGINH